MHEFFEGENSDVEGNRFDEKADGLLKFVVHNEKNKEESCSFIFVDAVVLADKKMDHAYNTDLSGA